MRRGVELYVLEQQVSATSKTCIAESPFETEGSKPKHVANGYKKQSLRAGPPPLRKPQRVVSRRVGVSSTSTLLSNSKDRKKTVLMKPQ